MRRLPTRSTRTDTLVPTRRSSDLVIEAAGGEACVNGDSVADFQAAKRMVQQAVDTYGRIDCVVNVAGILRDVIFHKMTEEDWDSVIQDRKSTRLNSSH